MKKYLWMSVSLLLCNSNVFAQSDRENQFQKNSSQEEIPPPAQLANTREWKIKTGLLLETENIEGNSDGKGAWEPSVYLELIKDRWTLGGSFYQEDHNTSHYYRLKGRNDGYDQYEITARYALVTSKTLALGMMGGVRNYRWSYYTGDNKGQTHNTQRYTLQPDWNLQLIPDLHFSGWLTMSQFKNNVNRNGLTHNEIESEAGINFAFNETLSVTLNYYIDRGWNKYSERDGEFSQQEMRLYLPVIFNLFSVNESKFSPYIRRTLTTWYYNHDHQRNERERDSRFGLLFEQALPHNLALSLEYGYELQLYPDASGNEPSRTKFHYTSIGLSYLF
ncbi:OmpG family monomeric porin [Klebsiella aerogenes]|uniref:OmpG family monomeric porin n=1 Tax=Klebsiella aerogenes TaxID=548 RepID=UPI002DBF9EFB|nr:OmpG family monomeric porin [Klebsiella aerogenes]MEB5696847.1 OmpG family monomeric porin [Klebsiella aerogenes]